MRYDVFLSYSHQADGGRAAALQRGLQRLARKWTQGRALRVFRDRSVMAADENLWHAIEAHLKESRYFILMASPSAARSEWVRREVRYWKEHRERETFLIAVVDGDLAWGGDDFDWSRTTTLPDDLASWFDSEPHWVDMRGDVGLSLDDAAFRDDVVATLAAAVHGRPKDELVGDHLREQRQSVRRRRGALVTLSLLLIVVSALALVVLDQRQGAVVQRDRALSRQLAAQSEAIGRPPRHRPLAGRRAGHRCRLQPGREVLAVITENEALRFWTS